MSSSSSETPASNPFFALSPRRPSFNHSFSGSPLSRAGILQPKPESYSTTHNITANNVSNDVQNDSVTARTLGSHGAVHTRSTIRLDTVHLSDILLSSRTPSSTTSPPALSMGMTPTVGPSNLSVMIAQSKQTQGAANGSQPGPSLPAKRSNDGSPGRKLQEDGGRVSSSDSVMTITPTRDASSRPGPRSPYMTQPRPIHTTSDASHVSSPPRTQGHRTPPAPPLRLNENTPLLQQQAEFSTKPKRSALVRKLSDAFHSFKSTAHNIPRECVAALPAVLLGSLLNILDGVSYGMIMFPASGIFADKGSMGVSIFFATAVIAQLVYTFGGSGFAGANGSMMIEVVPFFHILGNSIAEYIGEENEARVMATTLAAFALSSILTGMTFFLLGYLRLGAIIGFFPRHILVGCIGGVGVFLIVTGIAVCLRVEEDDLDLTLTTLRFVFSASKLVLWLLPLGLAVLLRIITARFRGQLVFPLYFLTIPIIFYIVTLAAGMDLGSLRRTGWIFDIQLSGSGKWYEFYQWLDLSNVDFGALRATLPTQLALLFFNVLHPPLNVPALSVSLNEDVDTNKELVGHGYSNFLAGLFGVVPNYLVYVNTLLFYRVGGGTRVAGFLLAVATAVLLLLGTGPIAYIPVMVVGALIFVLGIDLVKEALWDTRERVTWMEYITIFSIMVAMTAWDFVTGVLFGIIVSCLFFVVQNSRARSIRALYTGETAMSTVRRPSSQRAYIREVSKQTIILRLQGFLFFGTITHVESQIRNLISPTPETPTFIRFLVLDLTLVAGVDISAAESFVRVHRLLRSKSIVLVFCGFEETSAVGQALRSVGLIAGPKRGAEGVEAFEVFGDAIEWIENAYLRTWWRSRTVKEGDGVAMNIIMPGPDRDDDDAAGAGTLSGPDSQQRSPRLSHLRDVANRTLACDLEDGLAIAPSPSPSPVLGEPAPEEFQMQQEPFKTLLKALSTYDVASLSTNPSRNALSSTSCNARIPTSASHSPSHVAIRSAETETLTMPLEPHILILVPYFKPLATYVGQVLFRQGDAPDGLYVVESGVLRAIYEFGGCYFRKETCFSNEYRIPHRSSALLTSGGTAASEALRAAQQQRRHQGVRLRSHSTDGTRQNPQPYQITEAMVAGTFAGELSFLASHERNSTVIVERPGVVWKLSVEELRKAEKERPIDTARFVREVVKAAKIDYDILLSALATRQ